MTARERRAFARLVEIVCAPLPPLPPVADTDAVASFERWMAAAPRLNRIGARAALLLAGERVGRARAPPRRGSRQLLRRPARREGGRLCALSGPTSA